ncbi:MAG: hypothetical protein ACTSP4_10985 [Candidatus Hodarchaeales archaeon]
MPVLSTMFIRKNGFYGNYDYNGLADLVSIMLENAGKTFKTSKNDK